MKCAVLARGSWGLEVGNFPGALTSHGAGQSKQNLSRASSYQNATLPPRPARRSRVAGYARLSARWTRRETALGHSPGESKWKSKGTPCLLSTMDWHLLLCGALLSFCLFLFPSFPPSLSLPFPLALPWLLYFALCPILAHHLLSPPFVNDIQRIVGRGARNYYSLS